MWHKKKHQKNKRYFQAIAVMVGYIVGVGMFGLPYLTVRAGWIVFAILLIVLGLALIAIIWAVVAILTGDEVKTETYKNKVYDYKVEANI